MDTARARVECIANVEHMYRGHFFDADTMRFFRSKTYQVAAQIGTKYYFVTSERDDNYRNPQPRRYTLRVFDSTDPTRIDTVGEFQQYRTLAQAERALNKIANW